MGKDRSFMFSNHLFRTGGCSVLFTNNYRMKHRALVKLNCLLKPTWGMTIRAVIDGTGKGLQLSAYELEPARMALHRWGNTSTTGFWNLQGYMEAKKRLIKEDKILIRSFGAGFKCNNCLLEVIRDLKDSNVWDGCLDEYPPKTLINPFTERSDVNTLISLKSSLDQRLARLCTASDASPLSNEAD
ncbi:hypothetical protein Cgig2_029744 [Carnegiea gigantea]|uniref:FAE domain-containing protein n=1 Tax=Carnegiea gigantea TaxID=171969 RepID=A0A9Q1QAV5_9CARY|nr:hypothetical protein Cgig2_029744 [Carnegiea gigantea]